MKPGIYVIGRPLAMKWPANLGAHQFILLIPERANEVSLTLKDLGDGTKGIVVGAYAVGGKLSATFFDPSDTSTVHAMIADPRNDSRFQIERVNPEKSMCLVSLDRVIEHIVQIAKKYEAKEAKQLPSYPKGLSGMLSDDCRNSNSWAQTVIEIAVGPNAVLEDFDGADLCSDKRLAAEYFR